MLKRHRDLHALIQRGDRGSGPPPTHPPEKSQSYRVFVAVLVRIAWKITKLPSQQSMFGHFRPSTKWRFAGGPIMARFQRFGSSLPPHQLKKCLWQNFLDPRITCSGKMIKRFSHITKSLQGWRHWVPHIVESQPNWRHFRYLRKIKPLWRHLHYLQKSVSFWWHISVAMPYIADD